MSADDEARLAAAALEADDDGHDETVEQADDGNDADAHVEQADEDDGHDETVEQADDGDDEESDEGATLRETEDGSGGPAGESESFRERWFRNDRELDLEDTKAIWDPWGRGGLNRIAAAVKQAGGYSHFAPAFWAFVGTVEVGYKFLVLKGLVPGKSPPEEGGQ